MDDYAGRVLDLFNPDTSLGLQFLTGTWMLTLSAVFLAAYVLPLRFVHVAVTQLGLPTWLYGVILVLIVHAAVVLLRDDVIVHGDSSNKFVAAYRRSWPSAYIAQKFNVDQKVAQCVWFGFLDEWERPDDKRHGVWERLGQRGYACRFVYHVQSMARLLFWLSATWLSVGWVADSTLERPAVVRPGQIAALLLFLLVWVAMRMGNSIHPNATSGVWKRETEMNERMCRWIDKEDDAVRAACEEQAEKPEPMPSFVSEVDAG